MKRRAALAAVSGALLASAFATPASAGTYLGQFSSSTRYCSPNTSYAQEAISAGRSYQASAYGVITYWAAPPTPEPGHTLQLLVLQRRYPPSGVGHFFTVVAKDVVRSQITGDFSDYNGLRVPIEAGQEIGLYVPAGQPDVTVGGFTGPLGVCMFGADFGMGALNRYRSHPGDPPLGTELDYTTSGNGHRLNVFAYVEPDADRDRFGDETQDACPTNASTNGFCPRAPSTAPFRGIARGRKRKCNRRKAKQVSAAAKRKKCRRKKRAAPSLG